MTYHPCWSSITLQLNRGGELGRCAAADADGGGPRGGGGPHRAALGRPLHRAGPLEGRARVGGQLPGVCCVCMLVLDMWRWIEPGLECVLRSDTGAQWGGPQVEPWGHWEVRGRDEGFDVLVEATCDRPGTALRAPTAAKGLSPICRDTFYGKVLCGMLCQTFPLQASLPLSLCCAKMAPAVLRWLTGAFTIPINLLGSQQSTARLCSGSTAIEI